MKTLLCCIGRKENRYIREFVEHYKSYGFTNIVLYDNNHDGEDDFHDVIGDYISEGFVILKDYRNRVKCQFDAYNECYQEYGQLYDWIAFFDCDEFIELKWYDTISDYLSNPIFKEYEMIHLNWKSYGDNGHLHYEDKPVMERFKNPVLPYEFKRTYDFPENNHVKSIVRGGLSSVRFTKETTPHTPYGPETCCDSTGIPVIPIKWQIPFNHSTAYLKHYSTKSTEEYAEKILRGFPDSEVTKEWYHWLVSLYFKTNEATDEKIRIFNEKLGIDYKYKRNDVQLFMLCYDKKEYEFTDNEVMTPLQCGAYNGTDVCRLKDNTFNNISALNYFYSELTGIYWIWNNVKNAKYKGNTQYRRRLSGVDENLDYDKVFSDHDIICAKPYNYPANSNAFIPENNVYEGYCYSHCKDDIDDLGIVISANYPEYIETWEKVKQSEDLYYSNGFVLPAEKYDEYCSFLFNIIQGWLIISNIRTKEDLIVHVSRNIGAGKYKRFEIEGRDPMKCSTKEIEWQCKIGGFLSERILTLWIEHNIPKERRYEVEYEKMENTYI